MFPLVDQKGPNPLELFQIWLNLPRANKLVEPHFSMFWSDTIPKYSARDSAGRLTEVNVVAGQLAQLQAPPPPPKSWAARPESELAIWTIKMEPGAEWTLPPAGKGVNRTLYFFVGSSLRIGNRSIPSYSGVQLRAEQEVTLTNGPDQGELLLLQGRPIGEPVVQYGPFVMNTPAELRQAFQDYQRTEFGGWPWPSNGPVHPREEGRFARHPDGRVERAK